MFPDDLPDLQPHLPRLVRHTLQPPTSDVRITDTPFIADFVVYLRETKHLSGGIIASYVLAINSVFCSAHIIAAHELTAILQGNCKAWDWGLVLRHPLISPYEPLSDAELVPLKAENCLSPVLGHCGTCQ